MVRVNSHCVRRTISVDSIYYAMIAARPCVDLISLHWTASTISSTLHVAFVLPCLARRILTMNTTVRSTAIIITPRSSQRNAMVARRPF
jgi:hypothetical protein